MTSSLITKPPLTHLKDLSTSLGLYEHAQINVPRTAHGYCVDDVARGLVLLCHETELDKDSEGLIDVYLEFVLKAITPNGLCHNRMDNNGNWTDDASTSDWWGRAVWALGVAAVHAPNPNQRSQALDGFRTLAKSLTRDLMSLAFATLGAGEVLLAYPKERGARRIVLVAQFKLLPTDETAEWAWPEPRLRYSNGSIVHAVLLAGLALKDPSTIKSGIRMLDFLIKVETFQDHFSVTPVGGRGPRDVKSEFDQQPIELAAIASACAQAWAITGDTKWLAEIERAWNWFLGSNDVGSLMFVPETGGGYDGLHLRGPNLNQGAESTISMLTTAQHAFQLATSR